MRIWFLKRAMEQQGFECKVLNIGKSRLIESPEYICVYGAGDFVKKVIRLCLQGFRVHGHTNGDTPKGLMLTFIGMFVSLLTFKRPFLTFHAGPVQKYFPQSRSKLFAPAYWLLFVMAKRVICNNDAVKNNIVGYGISQKKVVPIQAFSRQYLEYEPREMNGKLGGFLETRKQIVVSYVYFRPEFFIENMIEAWAKFLQKHREAGLVIMGFDQNSEPIKELIAHLGIGDSVIFAGDLDHDEFLSMLKRADIYLRTPVKDGVCSSVLEALSLGTPVVASENNLRPASVVTYDNDNQDDLVRKLEMVLADLPSYRERVVTPEIKDTLQDEIDLLTKKLN